LEWVILRFISQEREPRAEAWWNVDREALTDATGHKYLHKHILGLEPGKGKSWCIALPSTYLPQVESLNSSTAPMEEACRHVGFR
jgi:hypothetical protein